MMNTVNLVEVSADTAQRPTGHQLSRRQSHPAVKILALIFFGVFSIVVVSIALVGALFFGLVLAVILAAVWARFGSKGNGWRRYKSRPRGMAEVTTRIESGPMTRASGNASFDGYRDDMLHRLDEEHRDFVAFVARLRETSDETEFQRFMEERDASARDAKRPR